MIEREVERYKYEQDSITQFVEERTGTGEYFQTENSALYNTHRDFRNEINQNRFLHRRFSQKPYERGFAQTRTTKCFWNGIRLTDYPRVANASDTSALAPRRTPSVQISFLTPKSLKMGLSVVPTMQKSEAHNFLWY